MPCPLHLVVSVVEPCRARFFIFTSLCRGAALVVSAAEPCCARFFIFSSPCRGAALVVSEAEPCRARFFIFSSPCRGAALVVSAAEPCCALSFLSSACSGAREAGRTMRSPPGVYPDDFGRGLPHEFAARVLSRFLRFLGLELCLPRVSRVLRHIWFAFRAASVHPEARRAVEGGFLRLPHKLFI